MIQDMKAINALNLEPAIPKLDRKGAGDRTEALRNRWNETLKEMKAKKTGPPTGATSSAEKSVTYYVPAQRRVGFGPSDLQREPLISLVSRETLPRCAKGCKLARASGDPAGSAFTPPSEKID